MLVIFKGQLCLESRLFKSKHQSVISFKNVTSCYWGSHKYPLTLSTLTFSWWAYDLRIIHSNDIKKLVLVYKDYKHFSVNLIILPYKLGI